MFCYPSPSLSSLHFDGRTAAGQGTAMTTRLRLIAEPFVVALPEIHLRKLGDPKARGRPQQRRRTRRADGNPAGDQVGQDRSGPPAGQDLVLLSV